jgi:hypothetical protein
MAQAARMELELSRNREVLGKHVSLIVLLLMQQFKLCSALHSEYFSQLLVDSNAILLALKTLMVDPKTTLSRSPDLPFQRFTDWFLQPDLLNSSAADSPSQRQQLHPETTICPQTLCIYINILRLVQKLVKRRTERVKILLHFKAHIPLKKLHTVRQPELTRYLMKIFKGLIPFMVRKWRQSHMKIITAIYTTLRPDLCADWIRYLDLNSNARESVVCI